MAASLICGRLTASLRNSGARNTLSSASKVSLCPRCSEALRLSRHPFPEAVPLPDSCSCPKTPGSYLTLASAPLGFRVLANALTHAGSSSICCHPTKRAACVPCGVSHGVTVFRDLQPAAAGTVAEPCVLGSVLPRLIDEVNANKCFDCRRKPSAPRWGRGNYLVID